MVHLFPLALVSISNLQIDVLYGILLTDVIVQSHIIIRKITLLAGTVESLLKLVSARELPT